MEEKLGTEITAYVTRVGEKEIQFEGYERISQNPFFTANQSQIAELEDYMDSVCKSLDSVGAKLRVEAASVPVGLGESVSDRLDAEITYAMMGINTVKGVEIDADLGSVIRRGNECDDELVPQGFLFNHTGGILGGISIGQDIYVNTATKPTNFIATSCRSIDINGNPVGLAVHGRHDPCVGLHVALIAEVMLALVLIDHALCHRT